MSSRLFLKDVSRLLDVKPYRITYALSVGLVPEPGRCFGNKRVFGPADVKRLADYFRVAERTNGDST